MTDEIVECFNCGRSNPEWAQVCRSCGVPLRRGEAARATPTGRFPTDRDSLVSIAAVVATILGAVMLGLFVSSLNPTEPNIGGAASASASPTASASVEATATAAPTETPAAEPSEAEGPTGTVVFGTQLDENDQVVEEVETFTPGMTFAHSVTSSEPFGVDSIGETVIRINEQGGENEVVERRGRNRLPVNPDAESAGFIAGDAASLLRAWGPGLYEMRVFIGDDRIARGQFRLSEG
jgi:hypothetical protein